MTDPGKPPKPHLILTGHQGEVTVQLLHQEAKTK